jgi:hypothetical protein
VLFDAAAGGDADGSDGLAVRGDEDESRPAVARVGTAFQVAGALENARRPGHRLLAHSHEAGKLASLAPYDGTNGKTLAYGGRMPKPAALQRLLDVLGVMRVDQPQGPAAAGAPAAVEGERVFFDDIDRCPSKAWWPGTCPV